MYWKRDSKNPRMGREGVWHLVEHLRLKADRSSDSAEGEAFWPCFCHRFESIRMRPILIRTLASVSVKIALSFHPTLPPQNSFINILLANTFDEESPETTESFGETLLTSSTVVKWDGLAFGAFPGCLTRCFTLTSRFLPLRPAKVTIYTTQCHHFLSFFLLFRMPKNLGICEAMKDRSGVSSKKREKKAAFGGAFQLGHSNRQQVRKGKSVREE